MLMVLILGSINVEVKRQRLLAVGFTRPLMHKIESPEHTQCMISIDPRVQCQFQNPVLPTILHRPCQQRRADSAPLKITRDTQPTNLTLACIVLLHTNHPNDRSARIRGNPKMRPATIHVRTGDIVNVNPSIILRDRPAQQTVLVQPGTRRLIPRLKTPYGNPVNHRA